MTENQEYTQAVDLGRFPRTPNVPIHDDFRDGRGVIQNLILSPISSVARITSAKGTTRANHWHRTDWHYAYVETGEVLYFERPVGATVVPEPKSYPAGTMFFTPPRVEHCMLFAADSVIFTFAQNVRSHDNHEADLVRVAFVTPEIANRFVP